MSGVALGLSGRAFGPWLRAFGVGLLLGLGAVVALRLELAAVLWRAGSAATDVLARQVGPVWIPMFLVGLRVAWLAGLALASRFGRVAHQRPVRPELVHLAPLFAALGLCGTVLGLRTSFDALRAGDFLTELPALLGGLGTAMTSTLVGLGLQITTLLLAASNPTWSRVRVRAIQGVGPEWGAGFELDGRPLGDGAPGLDALVQALLGRQPEALRLELDRELLERDRERVREALWRRIDASTPLRERPC